MKKFTAIIILTLSFQIVFPQKIDMINAPRNPIGFKHKKEHFFLKGDIYASSGKIFNKNGGLTYNYGTRYYYDDAGKITGNNYGDAIEYDNKGNISMYQYKSGSINNYSFSNKNLLVFQKNTYGEEKSYAYDSQDRLVKTIINKKGVFYQQRDLSYSKKGDSIIVSLQYTNKNRKPGFKGEYYYVNGFLVKEHLASGVFKYTVEVDNKGNKINFYTANDPKAKHLKTYNRYYSDANKSKKIEYGYYTLESSSTKKNEAVYLNNVRTSDFVISKGVRPNEKVIYDGLTKTYYSIPDVVLENHTLQTRIPAVKIISKGIPHISYSYDGKFINYIDGQNKAKARDFSFLGPHMVDYRVEKNIGRTYIVNDYKNIKNKAVKEVKLITTNTESVLFGRELEKDNFFIAIKGKHIDYKKARFEYLATGDPVIFIDDEPLYILTGFKSAKHLEVIEGKLYNGELDTIKQKEKNNTVTEKSNEDYNCTIGDCKEGWGQVKVDNVITDATFKDGAINGVAYISYPNDSYYHGQYQNNRRSGVGYYKWTNGNVYIGGWKDGKQHGYGYTMNKENQITSGGLYENGKLITELTSAYREGKVSGDCMGNCVDGFGRYTYNNGDKYWGFFENSLRANVGTYLWSNKSSYTGSYTVNGKRSGYGIFTYTDRSVFKGVFVNDKIDGLGIMKYGKSGNIVQGVFNNNGAKVRDY
jgi:hypothetical protein